MDYEEFINQLLNTYNQGSTEEAFEMLQGAGPEALSGYRGQAQGRLPAYTGGDDQVPTARGMGGRVLNQGGAGADAKLYRLLEALSGGVPSGRASDDDLDLIERMLRNR